MKQNFEIEIIEEYKISPPYQEHIQKLLQQAFPDYPTGQHFYRQLPTFRSLIWNSGQLIAHMGIDHRIIALDGKVYKAFGIVDLCVEKEYQSQKIASLLLDDLEKQGLKYQMDFILLIAQQFQFYLSHGFKVVDNTSKWLMLRNNQSFGVMHRKLENCLLYKPLSDKQWTTNGTLDFLGTLF